MKRGFTLIELMTVVGIMAMLGVAATSGYAALQRGMAERGAVAAVNAILKSAKERAAVDRVPTMIFFYNRLLREATMDENAIVVGEAVAVRRAGRISYVRSNYLYDEFTDLAHMFDVVSSAQIASRPGMKLWKIDEDRSAKMQYSVVADAVCQGSTILLPSLSSAVGTGTVTNNFEIEAYAFYKNASSGHEPSGGWTAGDAYGFEFATIQLPHNFIFGNNGVPTQITDVKEVKAVYFDPKQGNSGQVDVYFCQPNSGGLPQPHHKAGTASSEEKVTS